MKVYSDDILGLYDEKKILARRSIKWSARYELYNREPMTL